MQLKKMRELVPTLCASQVNKGHSSLSTSPQQASVDEANPRETNDGNRDSGYREPEEIKLHQKTCVKCSRTHDASALELQKWTCQQREDNCCPCSKCMLSVPSIVDVVTDSMQDSNTENTEQTSPNQTPRPFKVKSLQPDKYYCGKCRFPTKDPLQRKRKTPQHEETRSVCSYCSGVSCTQGELQRHLVMHTGTFPYKCKYCEYGAVRHDYIVKHTKRLRETDKQVKLRVANAERKTNCVATQSTEKTGLAQEVPLQSKSSNLPSKMTLCRIPGEIPESVCSSVDTECSPDSVCNQAKSVSEPSDIRIHTNENAVLEVEVYSLQKGPIMAGMPLTVVAPSKFAVPPDCLAEIVDIKKVNGTQQLILKLIPMKEMASGLVNCNKAESKNQCAEGEKTIAGRILSTLNESCVLENECHKDTECPQSSSSATLNCNLRNVHGENATCKGSAERENNCIPAISEISSDERNCSESFQRAKCAESRHLNYNLESSTCLAALFSEDKNGPQNGSLDASQGNTRVPPSSETKCFILSDAERECQNESDTKTDAPVSSLSASVIESQWNKSVHLDGSKNDFGAFGGEDMKSESDNIWTDSSEAPNVKNVGGPVISSVFSLSSGSALVPEGIKWDDTLRRERSKSLFCRKIAQLMMSAAASSMESQPASSLRDRQSNAAKEKLLSSLDCTVKQETNGLTTGSEQEPLPFSERPNCASSADEHLRGQEQVQPLSLSTKTRTRTRMAHKRCISSPVFIPQGTVLRVLNNYCIGVPIAKEKKSKRLLTLSTYYDECCPRPLAWVSTERAQDQSPLPTENELHETSKKRIMKNNRRQNRVLSCTKGTALNKSTKGMMESKVTKKKGANLGNCKGDLCKKRQRFQDDYFLKIMPVLTRHLRLAPFKKGQLIQCPRRNQPVIVLNHPDIDSPEVINVMKAINKYKGNVVKVALSKRTISCLGVKRHRKRLTIQNSERAPQIRKWKTLKMKLKKTLKNNYKIVECSVGEASMQTFKCWFCDRMYVEQEEWISHGQEHLTEATRGWDVLRCSLPRDK